MRKFRVLVTGGGTGGHILPLIAVIEELQILASSSGVPLKLRYLGAYGTYKTTLEANDVKVWKLVPSKLRRYFSLENFIDFFKFFIGLVQALWYVFWFMPDVLFSKGGPGALPVVVAAWFYRVPIVVHESDSVPGLTNTLSAKFAKTITLGFEGANVYFKGRGVYVGNPVRRGILLGEQRSQSALKELFGFNPAKPLMLVFGGSQGSVRINDFVLDNLPQILEVTQILHQTGIENYKDVKNQSAFVVGSVREDLRGGYAAVDYFDIGIRDAYRASDVIMGRAGASAIAEAAAFGKPMMLVPLPESAGDHQRQNAYEYAKSGGAVVLEEENLLPNLFISALKEILENSEKYTTMSEAAKNYHKQKEAAPAIAKMMLGYYK
ncbi:MAG: glycosyltransferase [Candidatus Colwellbacteria bacterium]|nr:glycosyltransferase [Candidatus Colwellbacteria bacterium]